MNGDLSAWGQRLPSQHVRNESAYPPIAAGEQTSRLVGSVPLSKVVRHLQRVINAPRVAGMIPP
jgi:hypothetical protein